MNNKRCPICKKTFIIFLVSIFALTLFGMYISVREAHAEAAPTVIRIPNPTPQQNDQFGMAVAGIDDIDSDGVGDLIVGAPGADEVYLLSGADLSIIGIIEPTNDMDGYRFGYAVSGVGDLNDDGIEDIAVGAPGPSNSTQVSCNQGCSTDCPNPKCGRVYVFSGFDGDLMLTLVPNDHDFWAFGSAVAPLGDVNCDGIPDIAVGAPVFKTHSMGKVYAFSGEDGSQIWTTTELEPCAGETQAMASFGAHLAVISDVTKDGYNDLLVGAPKFDCDPDQDVDLTAGRAFILDGTNGTIFRVHENPVPTLNDHFGAGVSAIGDQNGDGIGDYCVGEPGIDVIYLFSGINGALIRKIESPVDASTDFFGYSVAGVDDKDRDGKNDLWVAAPKRGVVYLINGKGEVLIELIDDNPVSSAIDGGFGWQIAATADLNDDSGMDLIIGKPAESIGWQNSKAGAVYLVLGAYVNTPPVADAGPDRTISADENCLAIVRLDGSGSYDPDGDPLTYEWTWSCGSASGVKPYVTLPLGVNVITLTVSDGMDTDTDTVVIKVIDTTPPMMICPPNITAEQTNANGTPVNLGNPTVIDNCDDYPVVTNNAPAVFPLGKTIVTWIAKDFSGNTSSCKQVVTIVDTTPPAILSINASPNNLWPPDHQMVPVTVTVVCKDICDINPVCMIISVGSSQPVNGTGDGDTAPDWVVTGDLSVNLRAERSGNDKAGRIYTITVQCTDFSGNWSRASVNVIVPHDQGKKSGKSKKDKNAFTYYGLSVNNPVSQTTGFTPIAQSTGVTTVAQSQQISTSAPISVNVNNISTKIVANNTYAPITVVIQTNQGNVVQSNQGSNVTKTNKAKANTPSMYTYNSFSPSNVFNQVFNNSMPFSSYKTPTFFSGNNNWAFGGNNNWGFGGNNNWSLGRSIGNHWGWNKNLYTSNANPFNGFSFNSSSLFSTNTGFNAYPFR